MTPERRQKLKILGSQAGFGLLVFLIAFYVSFPYERVKEQVVAHGSRNNLDVEIAHAGPTFGVGLSFDGIKVASRPTDGSPPTRLEIDEASVRVSPLQALLGRLSLSISAEALGGEIDVDWEGTRTAGRVRVETHDISLARLPGVTQAINLPLDGTLGLEISLAAPAKTFSQAEGSVSWQCEDCAIGDGKAKLKVPSNPLLAEGLSVPRIRLGDFGGGVVFQKGVGRLQGVQARSPDGELHVEGEIHLADQLPLSRVDLYLRFKLSDALIKKASNLEVLLQLAESMGKRQDGFFGMRLSGTFARLGAPQWSRHTPFAAVGSAGQPPLPRPMVRSLVPRPPVPMPSTAPPSPSQDLIPGAPAAPQAPPTPPTTTEGQLVDPKTDPNANMPRYPTLGPPEEAPAPPAPDSGTVPINETEAEDDDEG